MWFTEINPARVMRMAPSGIVTGEFTQAASGELFESSGLALGLDGDMWFAGGLILNPNNEFQGRVGYVTPAGVVTEFSTPTVMGGPVEIASDGLGGIWFTTISEIGRMTEGGTVNGVFPVYAGSGGLPELTAIARGEGGDMWFAALSSESDGRYFVGRVTPAGAVKTFPIPAPYRAAESIALGADGNMWFTQSPATVGRITPSGTVSEFAVPAVSGSYNGLVLGPDGNMWFTEGAGAVGRITPEGVVTSFSLGSGHNGLPLALAQSNDGELWYSEKSSIGRIATPLAPVNEAPPAIAGQTVEGQTLSTSVGSWMHNPSTFAYQWQICDGSGLGCKDIANDRETTHVLTTAEVGYTVRAIVTASNVGGATAVASAVSGVVQATPHSTAVVGKRPAVNEPLPVVAAAMTWKFGWVRTYTVVESLVVRGIPAGAVVDVACIGHGCTLAHWRSGKAVRRARCRRRTCRAANPVISHGVLSLDGLFGGRHLKVGARVVVSVLKPGSIGKSFTFTIRANRPPRVQITCLGAGPSNPAGEC
jgi:virginiamycin B lyase